MTFKYQWNKPPVSDQDKVDVMRELWEDCTHVKRHFHPNEPIYTTKCERSKGYLSCVGLVASGYIGSAKDFELIALVLNNLPMLLDAYEAQNKVKSDV